jgi:hypothetical protein
MSVSFGGCPSARVERFGGLVLLTTDGGAELLALELGTRLGDGITPAGP